ncbi:hypothetical protein ACLF3M_06955, partial [Falsiroseomonas sp. HW251]
MTTRREPILAPRPSPPRERLGPPGPPPKARRPWVVASLLVHAAVIAAAVLWSMRWFEEPRELPPPAFDVVFEGGQPERPVGEAAEGIPVPPAPPSVEAVPPPGAPPTPASPPAPPPVARPPAEALPLPPPPAPPLTQAPPPPSVPPSVPPAPEAVPAPPRPA